MQSDTIFAPNAWAVGLNETFLPQYLKHEGYRTYGVGKVFFQGKKSEIVLAIQKYAQVPTNQHLNNYTN